MSRASASKSSTSSPTFKLQADAQLKAWREAADELGSDAKKFASERRGDIDAAVERMNADAVEAEKQLETRRGPSHGPHLWQL